MTARTGIAKKTSYIKIPCLLGSKVSSERGMDDCERTEVAIVLEL